MPRQRWSTYLSGAAIAAAGVAAYHNSFSGPFVLDDAWNIAANPTIRHLWPPGQALSPPRGLGVGGRPLYNLSFALNYAWGGLDVRGYHIVNLVIHLLAGLTLFGVMRRTLKEKAESLALAVALIWTVHPLLTESVTYISERSELLMGLFYLLTLYGFIRGFFTFSIFCCFLGMAAKEVMVTAPAVVFLYDRTFVSGTFSGAWRRRWRYYLGLAASWLLLAFLLRGSGAHGIGFGHGVSARNYALTECKAVADYLRLAVWPHPLVFDYDLAVIHWLEAVWPQALGLVVLGMGSAIALLRPALRDYGGQAFGFAGAWFFLTLAPTSSFVPIGAQPMAENRMYLPLAAVVAVAVAGIGFVARRHTRFVCAVLAVVFILLTVQRNAVYASGVSLWSDTVAKCPQSARARSNFGAALYRAGRKAEALGQFEKAAELDPNDALIRLLLGNVLAEAGRTAEAGAQYRAALRIDPSLAPARERLDRLR